MKEISSDVLRGFNDLMILATLLKHDSYGYEISREISTRSCGAYDIKETTLYSAFGRLVKEGYVRSYEGTITYGKQRTYYAITENGLNFYRTKCEEWQYIKELINKFVEEI